MSNQLYVKTQGPVPEGVPITAGKVYPVRAFYNQHNLAILDDLMSREWVYIDAPHAGFFSKQGGWCICDQRGNPVPAPWESEQEPEMTWGEALTIAADLSNQKVYGDAIDYRAHAERLAEALQPFALLACDEPHIGEAECYNCKARAALAAYNKDKGV